MKRQDRIPEVYFYEWSISRWRTSETRARLTMAGRGIYRELLDLCYAQGSIPKDFQTLASLVGCAPIEIEQVWANISRHFIDDKLDKNRLRNKTADVIRKNFFKYVSSQRVKGKKGGIAKSSSTNDISNSGLAVASAEHKPRVDEGREDKSRLQQINTASRNPSQQPQRFGEWPLTGKAICSYFPDTGYKFVLDVAQAAMVAVFEVEVPKIKLTDEILAKAVNQSYKAGHQNGAGLFLTTVPDCIRSWAADGIRPRDSPNFDSPPETNAQRRTREAAELEKLRERGIVR
jgi:hypothetical protein